MFKQKTSLPKKFQERSSAYSSLKISLIYVILGISWILFSDTIALVIFQQDVDRLSSIQTFKGTLYVVTTAVILFILMQRDFRKINQSQQVLKDSYHATLEGWVQALHLRDEETQEHTQRVIEDCIKLAKAMKVDEKSLIHIRRGALLHDIGKLGISDDILMKPGALTPEERKIIELHPVFARDLIREIEFLQPALAIPYCHHEKWDGSGYPQGLQGEDIPLEARIFAVIDVWDALTSDRPYRDAWTDEEAERYILEQSGKHFDPQVVETWRDVFQIPTRG